MIARLSAGPRRADEEIHLVAPGITAASLNGRSDTTRDRVTL
jgi:hypothetical protein